MINTVTISAMPQKGNNIAKKDHTLLQHCKEWLNEHPKTKSTLKGAAFGLTTAGGVLAVYPTRDFPLMFTAGGVLGALELPGISPWTGANSDSTLKKVAKTLGGFALGTLVAYYAAINVSFGEFFDGPAKLVIPTLVGATGTSAFVGFAYRAAAEGISKLTGHKE